MPTYRDLFEKLGQLTPDQLDQEIKIIPAGFTDNEANETMAWWNIPYALKLVKADYDLYHYSPKPEEGDEENFMEAGVADLSEDEINELGVKDDDEYTLVCRKGEMYFKVLEDTTKFSIEAHLGDLDTSILHL